MSTKTKMTWFVCKGCKKMAHQVIVTQPCILCNQRGRLTTGKAKPKPLGPVAKRVFILVDAVYSGVLVVHIADALGLTRAQVFGALRTIKARGLVTVSKTEFGSFKVVSNDV